MKKLGIALILIFFGSAFLLGCNQQEYNEMVIEKAEIEQELIQMENENVSLKGEMKQLESEIDDLNKDNKKIFDNTLSAREKFSIKGEEYTNLIMEINSDPQLLRYFDIPADVVENIKFEKTTEHFINLYSCEIYENEKTGETLEIQIRTLDTDDVINVKIIYNHGNINVSNLKAGNYAYNYTLIVLGAFIMQNREDTNLDKEFLYYLDRFAQIGTYYEGNAWLIAKDNEGVYLLEILPIGLLHDVDTLREEH